MSLTNVNKIINSKTDPDFKIMNLKEAIFILPKKKELRDLTRFKEIKFVVMGGKKPIYAFFPRTDTVSFFKFKSHFNLIIEVLKYKYSNKINYTNISSLSKNMIFGSYDVNKKKITYCEESLTDNKNILKKSVRKILTKKLKQNIENKKRIKNIKKKNIFPLIKKISTHRH